LLANSAASGKVYKINSIMIANVDGTNAADVTVDINTAAGGGGTSYALANYNICTCRCNTKFN
jgi:hypothetical protein